MIAAIAAKRIEILIPLFKRARHFCKTLSDFARVLEVSSTATTIRVGSERQLWRHAPQHVLQLWMTTVGRLGVDKTR